MYPSNRRSLHQPLSPLDFSSSQPPSFPKYPFSASSNPPPFFPFYPPPLPTFPANISSLVTPSHNASYPSKLLLLITLPTLSLLLLLSLLAAIFLRRHRRRRSSDNTHIPQPGSDTHRLTATSPTLESPELRPLPPLPRHSRRSYSDDDVFYSPRGEPERPPSPASSGGSPASSFSLPPPPLVDGETDDGERRHRRLKPLHWDKVRARSERNMVWDHLKSCSSFQLRVHA